MENKLMTTNFRGYRYGDILQYLKDTLSNLDSATAVDLSLESERQALSDAVAELNAKWQPERRSLLTPEIAAIDKQRSNLFNGFKMTADCWSTNHYDMEVRYACKVILENIKAHGRKITRMRYQLKTATIRAIMNDCEGVHASFVATAGLGTWIDKIKTLNEAFQTKYMERSEDLGRVEKGLVADLVRRCTEQYQVLATMFAARMNVAAVDQDPLLSVFLAVMQTWNSITAQYNEAVYNYDTDTEEEEDTAFSAITPPKEEEKESDEDDE